MFIEYFVSYIEKEISTISYRKSYIASFYVEAAVATGTFESIQIRQLNYWTCSMIHEEKGQFLSATSSSVTLHPIAIF